MHTHTHTHTHTHVHACEEAHLSLCCILIVHFLNDTVTRTIWSPPKKAKIDWFEGSSKLISVPPLEVVCEVYVPAAAFWSSWSVSPLPFPKSCSLSPFPLTSMLLEGFVIQPVRSSQPSMDSSLQPDSRVLLSPVPWQSLSSYSVLPDKVCHLIPFT